MCFSLLNNWGLRGFSLRLGDHLSAGIYYLTSPCSDPGMRSLSQMNAVSTFSPHITLGNENKGAIRWFPTLLLTFSSRSQCLPPLICLTVSLPSLELSFFQYSDKSWQADVEREDKSIHHLTAVSWSPLCADGSVSAAVGIAFITLSFLSLLVLARPVSMRTQLLFKMTGHHDMNNKGKETST